MAIWNYIQKKMYKSSQIKIYLIVMDYKKVLIYFKMIQS